MEPTVVSVNRKPTPGVGKLPQDEILLIANHGVQGDYHAGPFVRHRGRAKKDATIPNVRQVHLIHAELFDEMAAVGITVTPGAMGENITTRGLALLDLAPGTRLHIGEIAVVEISGLRNPCKQLDGVDKRLLAKVAFKDGAGELVRKAGIMGVVVEGGVVRPGDVVRVVVPEGVRAGVRLEPV